MDETTTTRAAKTANLTSAEHALLATFRRRMSDRARNALLGISLDEAHRLLFSIRAKLNLDPARDRLQTVARAMAVAS